MRSVQTPSFGLIALRLLTTGMAVVAVVALLAAFRDSQLLIPMTTTLVIAFTHTLTGRRRRGSEPAGRVSRISTAFAQQFPAAAQWVGPGTVLLRFLLGLVLGALASTGIWALSFPLGFLGPGAAGLLATLLVMTTVYTISGRHSLRTKPNPGPLLLAIADAVPALQRPLTRQRTLPVLVGVSAARALLVQILKAVLVVIAGSLTSVWWGVSLGAIALLCIATPEIVRAWLSVLRAEPTTTRTPNVEEAH